LKRPAASELTKILWDWYVEVKDKKDSEFAQRTQETKKINKVSPVEARSSDY
jgi:hypothetical protein